jgi:hypothetical protein
MRAGLVAATQALLGLAKSREAVIIILYIKIT